MRELFDIAKLIRIGIVAVGCLGAWAAVKFKYEGQGVTKERARVEAKGKEVDAKAQAARRRATSDADRVLNKYYRD